MISVDKTSLKWFIASFTSKAAGHFFIILSSRGQFSHLW